MDQNHHLNEATTFPRNNRSLKHFLTNINFKNKEFLATYSLKDIF